MLVGSFGSESGVSVGDLEWVWEGTSAKDERLMPCDARRRDWGYGWLGTGWACCGTGPWRRGARREAGGGGGGGDDGGLAPHLFG